KMVSIRQGDDWGHPCCLTKDVPDPLGVPPGTDCSMVAQEDASFYLGDVAFGLAFAPPAWPAPWGGSAFVAAHGTAGSWKGARVMSVAMDAETGLPLPGTAADFATGWDDGTLEHGRPAALELSSDGRLFVANDNDGAIIWIAPL